MSWITNIWRRSKNGKDKEDRFFLRYAIIATAVFLLSVTVFKRDNLFRWVEAGFTVRSQEKQMEFLKTENERLEKNLEMLTTDRDSLEKFAREQFLFAEPDEDVYILE